MCNQATNRLKLSRLDPEKDEWLIFYFIIVSNYKQNRNTTNKIQKINEEHKIEQTENRYSI